MTKVESLLSSQKLFKIVSFKNSCRLTIELLETDEDDGDDEDNENEEIAEAEKWAEYVEKYCGSEESMSEEVRARLASRVPVFLTKNAHALRRKYESALRAKRSGLDECGRAGDEGKEMDSLLADKQEDGEVKVENVMDDVAMRDETVYKFQASSYKLVHGANSTSVMYRKNAFRNAKRVTHLFGKLSVG